MTSLIGFLYKKSKGKKEKIKVQETRNGEKKPTRKPNVLGEDDVFRSQTVNQR